MTILLYKDGRLVIDDGNPIEGNALEGLVACVSDPRSGDMLKFDGKQWVAGAAASGLPAVSGDDNGKVLTVVEGEWAPAAGGGGGGVLVVTENEGTLDKTWQEIYDAMLSTGAIFRPPTETEEAYSFTGLNEYNGQYFVSSSAGEWASETKTGYPAAT